MPSALGLVLKYKSTSNNDNSQVGQGFAGCMKNLSVTQGGVTTLYSLGNPADFQDEESFKVGNVRFLVLDFSLCLFSGAL